MHLTIFPANNGDSFLIETINNTVILIDGGYVSTYRDFIKPKLLELSKSNKVLTHLIVTHIDKDHISGIVKLIEENKENEVIRIENVWHNSYSNLKKIDDKISFKGKSIDKFIVNYSLKDEREDSVNKNVSAVQGSTLASLIKKYNYNINSQFNRESISVDTQFYIESKDVIFRILSPDQEKLLELKKKWKRELFKLGYSSDENLDDFNEDVFEYILSLEKEKRRMSKRNVSKSNKLNIDKLLAEEFIEDNSVTNGSSIAFVLEYDSLRFLFLADAHPTLILNSLKKHYGDTKLPIQFDVIKISHHGSKNNTSLELLNYIDSRVYIISTNGKGSAHNHPDIETIARIISRKTKYTRKLYFNYPLAMLAAFKEEGLMKKYNYEIIENENNMPIELNFDYE